MPIKLKSKPVSKDDYKVEPQAKVESKKAKNTSIEDLETILSGIAHEVDEYVEAEQALSALTPAYKEASKARDTAQKKLLESYFKIVGNDDTTRELDGEVHSIQIGPPHTRRQIIEGAVPMVYAYLESIKPGLFAELASVPLGKVDAYLTEEQLKAVVETKITDRRTVKVIK